MQSVFTKNNLNIGLRRDKDNNLALDISSDFSGSQRKSQLFVNKERFSGIMENFWKSIKSTKIRKANLGFSDIDHYDDVVDVFEVPYFIMERGLRKTRVGSREFGSIPKEWSADLMVLISDTKSIGPIMDTVQLAAGKFLTEDHKKAIIKAFRPVLQGKQTSSNFHYPEENIR